MYDCCDILRSLPHFVSMAGASPKEIEQAEIDLDVKFARDYFDYVIEFGTASANGHELIGVCKAARLSVVETTRAERKKTVTFERAGT